MDLPDTVYHSTQACAAMFGLLHLDKKKKPSTETVQEQKACMQNISKR